MWQGRLNSLRHKRKRRRRFSISGGPDDVRTGASVQGMSSPVPVGGSLRMRALLRPTRGSIRLLAVRRDGGRRARSRRAHDRSGATRSSSRIDKPEQPRSPRASRRWSRPTAWPKRLGMRELWVKNDAVNTRRTRFKDRVVSVRDQQGRRTRLQDRRLCVDRQPRQRASRRTPPRPGSSATSSSRPTSSRAEDPRARASTARTWCGVNGNYDDVNRLCTRARRPSSSWAFVNINMRPYYARRLQDDRLRDRRAARLEGCRTASSRRSPPARCSPRSHKGFDEWIEVGLSPKARCRSSTARRPRVATRSPTRSTQG